MSRWLDGIMGRRTTTTRHDPRANRPPSLRQHHLLIGVGAALVEGANVALGCGAAVALVWAAWSYYQSKTCLRTYGRDMTAMTRKETDPVIGRDDEIESVIDILCRRTKNCAALVGAAGVIPPALVEGLAHRIATGAIPPALVDARVVEVDLGAMVAGARLRGMFEKRIKNVISQAEASNGKVILFIDEMHMLYGVGGGLTLCTSGSNLLKPALARGRIRCIAATTFDDYRTYIEKDPALERRFQKVHVEEPTTEATISILRGLKQCYQHHHGVEIQDAALVAAARLAARYITDRQFPDKAIDLVDDACTTAARKMMQIDSQDVNTSQSSSTNKMKESIVSPDHVAHVVSRRTGIPITTLNQEEKDKLIYLADKLHDRVIGQDKAVNLVAEAVLRSRAGLGHPGQPIGSFLFLGSTGVGKTELAKALAEQLFDSEKMLLRFDMSEYVSQGSALRLVGAPPSYHGYEDGGQLTEKVKRRPFSVILFDEVEKADTSVSNIFLQLLDDGVLTDGKGRTVDFKNTIIIMTSNLGAEYLGARIAGEYGENTTETERDLLMKQVRKHFKPELLNRLSEIVIFEPLSRDQLKEVVRIQMTNVATVLAEKRISLFASDDALDTILLESYNPMYGARPIRRWVQQNVMTTLSKMLMKGEISEGSIIHLDATKDKKGLKYEVEKVTSAEANRER